MGGGAPLPFSQASENNKHAILEVLCRHLPERRSLLEIGSGTGQHGEFFAPRFPGLRWQCTELAQNVAPLNRRLAAAGQANLPAALSLDVTQADWKISDYEAIFSANCLHIMSCAAVECFFAGIGRHLASRGLLLVYGPFKYGGAFTTVSNARFDLWLKDRDSRSGIRDFEWVDSLARQAGLSLVEDNPMPANNQLLVWLAE